MQNVRLFIGLFVDGEFFEAREDLAVLEIDYRQEDLWGEYGEEAEEY
jgi:hypothetical protein